jgi:DNA-binding response OmpR family regulator
MKKILVVDDDVDILALVRMMLAMHDFNVDAISRWEKIPDSLAHFEPDLILLDISLIGADGRVICKQLKQSDSTRHIPVILFSANTEKGSSYRDYQAEDFIAKPFEMSHFLETIRNHVN